MKTNSQYANYFRTESKIVGEILKTHLMREALESDFIKTEIIKKLNSSVCKVKYQGIIIGEFANKL